MTDKNFPVHVPQLVLYRFHDHGMFPLEGKLELVPSSYAVLRTTPKGYWIKAFDTTTWRYRERWVSNDGKKRFAYPTVEEAAWSYLQRKKREVAHAEERLMRAVDRYELAARLVNHLFPDRDLEPPVQLHLWERKECKRRKRNAR